MFLFFLFHSAFVVAFVLVFFINPSVLQVHILSL